MTIEQLIDILTSNDIPDDATITDDDCIFGAIRFVYYNKSENSIRLSDIYRYMPADENWRLIRPLIPADPSLISQLNDIANHFRLTIRHLGAPDDPHNELYDDCGNLLIKTDYDTTYIRDDYHDWITKWARRSKAQKNRRRREALSKLHGADGYVTKAFDDLFKSEALGEPTCQDVAKTKPKKP